MKQSAIFSGEHGLRPPPQVANSLPPLTTAAVVMFCLVLDDEDELAALSSTAATMVARFLTHEGSVVVARSNHSSDLWSHTMRLSNSRRPSRFPTVFLFFRRLKVNSLLGWLLPPVVAFGRQNSSMAGMIVACCWIVKMVAADDCLGLGQTRLARSKQVNYGQLSQTRVNSGQHRSISVNNSSDVFGYARDVKTSSSTYSYRKLGPRLTNRVREREPKRKDLKPNATWNITQLF